jgi:hypothetical protein
MTQKTVIYMQQQQQCHLAVCPETVQSITMSEEPSLQVNTSITVKNKTPVTYNTQDKVISLIRNKATQAHGGVRYISIHSRVVHTEEETQCAPKPV